MHNSSIKIYVSLVIVLLAALGLACGPAAQTAKPVADALQERGAKGEEARYKLEPAKERGGKLTFTSIAFGNPNDPHLVVTATGRTYSMPVANGLLMGNIYGKTYPIAAELAKSWEASRDGLTYTFKLHEGVKFHNAAPVNGREFTSEDAKYSLLRITADPSVVLDKWKARFQRRLDFGEITGIETPDKYTLVVTLKEPYAPFLDSIAHPGTQMLAKEFVEQFPDKIITEGMIGTGAYLPVEYKNQQLATYKRNPAYWKKDSDGKQLPYLDELVGVFFADEQSRLAAFRARNLDVTTVGRIGNLDSIAKDMPGTKAFITPSTTIANFRFNMKVEAFRDVRVRRAIHLAVNRHEFLDLIQEGLGVIAGPVTPTYPTLANNMDWLLSQPGFRKDKGQDLVEAKRLMKEAGYEGGFNVNLLGSVTTGADSLALLQEQLKPLNISLKSEVVDYAGQWVPRSTQGEFELSHMTHAVTADADGLLSPHFITSAPRNYGKFSDATLDDLINKQRMALTLEDRRKFAQEAEKRLFEVVPMVFMYNLGTISIAQPWVHNAGDGPFSGATVYMVERLWMDKH